MAFADPQSVTIATVAQSLPRVGSNDTHSIYRKDDSTVKLTIEHRPGKTRTQSRIRLDFTKIAADPLMAGVNREVGTTWQLLNDRPNVGLTAAEIKDVGMALVAYANASTGANLTKLLGGEH